MTSKKRKLGPAKGEKTIWRKDRFILSIVFLVLIIGGILVLFLDFSTQSTRIEISKYENIDTLNFEIKNVDIADYARSDAMRVINAPEGSMERHDALLFIKSRETEMRMIGLNKSADEYINSVNRLINKK